MPPIIIGDLESLRVMQWKFIMFGTALITDDPFSVSISTEL